MNIKKFSEHSINEQNDDLGFDVEPTGIPLHGFVHIDSSNEWGTFVSFFPSEEDANRYLQSEMREHGYDNMDEYHEDGGHMWVEEMKDFTMMVSDSKYIVEKGNVYTNG